LPPFADIGPVEPLALQAVDGVAGLVGDPLLVDVLVDRGSTRITARPRLSTRIAEPRASITSMDSVFFSSHGPGVEGVGLGGQRADRAQVDDVALSSDVIALSR
jgi:hypothetical protein